MKGDYLSIHLAGYLFVAALLFSFGCDSASNDDSDDPDTPLLPDQAELTHLPCDPATLNWMQPFGNVDHGGGNAFFHPGFDFGTDPGGAFYTSADGIVTGVDLDTRVGAEGTNYRITIRVAAAVELDYHFEVIGDVPEDQRRDNVFVERGDHVTAGQRIANLIVATEDLAHVHWSVFEFSEASKCPLDYFRPDVAGQFEALYDSLADKRPVDRLTLCE
jgi:hypothetical protein